jgi:ligand-binding sensor domain-containing protein
VAVALQPAAAWALDPAKAVTQYARETWGLREGLPQLSVQDIAQTPDGYLWLATEEGLVRFDGDRFTVFDDTNSKGLPSRRIESLVTGPDGALWIGTNGGGLAHLQQGRFVSYGAAQGFNGDVVLALAVDRQGGLWVGTEDAGLAHLEGGSWRQYRVADGLPSNEVTELAATSDGSVWAGTTRGLVRLKDGVLRPYALPGAAVEAAAVHEDRSGRIWVSDRRHGLYRLQDDRLVQALTPADLGQATVLSILDDSDGNVWLATDGGLKRWTGGALASYGARQGLLADTVLKLWEDPRHQLWVGTLGSGLVRLSDGDFTTYSREEGLPHDFVRTISEGAGDIWIGSRGGGLVRLPQGHFMAPQPAPGIPHPFVYSVLSARDGSIWAGTHGGGLARLRGGRTTVYTRANGLPGDLVRALYEDDKGVLWIGCESAGLGRWDGTRFERFSARDGLGNDSVYSLLKDRRGDLWVGTNDGLSRMRDGRFQTYRAADGLAGNQVRSLYEDAAGALWIGTLSGLSRFQAGRFSRYEHIPGLAEAVFSILEDAQGHLWLSGNRGVRRVSRGELERVAAGGAAGDVRPRLFGVADGLKNRECNGGVQPAGWKGRDGRLWFATMQGATVVDPGRLRAADPPPRPVLEDGRADGRPLDLRDGVQLPPGEGRLEFGYTSPELSRPESLSFRYRLEGLDKDWQPAGRRRLALYTNVPPGRYRFDVMACSEDGRCSTLPRPLELELAPRFVQSRAFTGLCVAGAVLAVWSGHRLRVRTLRAHERELQRRVDEAISSIRVLNGLLPMCAWCKKIRDDQGYWNQLESYIRSRSHADFTHSICPECAEKMLADRRAKQAAAEP